MEWIWMDELLLLIKLSLTKVQVEIMTVTAVVTVVVTVTVVVIMEVDVDQVEEENALSAESQDILLGSAQVKVQGEAAGMVAGMISMVVEVAVGVVAVVVMVVVGVDLIEMETDIVDAAGILVVVQVLEVIDSVVTAQGHMNVGGQEEVSVLDRTIASDSGM